MVPPRSVSDVSVLLQLFILDSGSVEQLSASEFTQLTSVRFKGPRPANLGV